MLETNKPYMFGSSTTTTTTTTKTKANNTLPPPPPVTATIVTTPLVNNSRPILNGQAPPPSILNSNKYYSYHGSEDYSSSNNGYSAYQQYGRNKLLSSSSSSSNSSSAFGHHQDNYTSSSYKSNNNRMHSTVTATTATPPRLPPTSAPTLLPQSQSIKKDEFNMLPPPQPIAATVIEEHHSNTTTNGVDWLDNSNHNNNADLSDSRRLKKQKELTSKMERLNLEFLERKEMIYSEKLLDVNKELGLARQDNHEEYLEGLRKLELKRQKKIANSELFRKYQHQVTNEQFELEIYQAQEEYTSETLTIREKLFAILEEKRRKLKEEKDNCELYFDVVLENQSRLVKRNLRKRGPENADNKSNRKKQMNVRPTLMLQLKEEDIFSDLQAMRSGSLSPLKASPSTNKKK